MTEEEVKSRVVLPYLTGLGLTPLDLRLETSFSLQIGTNRVTVNGSQRTRGTVGGRLDILVTYGAKNLFIVEVKEAGHALDDDDRIQGISYACLVYPIAPYVLLTNGSDWELFDTITRAKVDHRDFRIKDGYRLALPDADRNAAIEFFLGYSTENLLHFSQSQVVSRMKPLAGSPADLTKKYIRELTVPRNELLKALDSFEASTSNGFLVLADSGTGKTSSLCDYSLRRLAAGKPTLFFSGATLEAGLAPALIAEFAWVFPEQLSAPVLIKRICSVAKGVPVVVVVDAVDEWTYSQRAQSLVNLLHGAGDLPIKFVFSCKTNAWDAISQPQGSDLGFSPHLFPPFGERTRPAFSLTPFSDEEFGHAIQLYRRVFMLRALIEDKVLGEARANPFLLRVMFVVAAESGSQMLSFSSLEFFERYFELVTRKTGQARQAEMQLIRLARFMFDQNRDLVSHEDVHTVLGLSAAEAPLPALFEQNLLQQSAAGVTFYFQQLRSYLISFRALNWPAARGEDLREIKNSGVQGEAFTFYFRYASEAQLRVVIGPTWDNLGSFRDFYAKIIERDFPNLAELLTPGDGPRIGFLAEYVVSQCMLGAYTFKRQSAESPLITLVPVTVPFGKSNLPALHGAQELHFTHGDNFPPFDDPKRVLKQEIVPRLDKIIKEHGLNPRGCDQLVREMVVGIIYNNRRTFQKYFDPQGRMLFPIPLAEVSTALLRARLEAHFEHEIYSQKRLTGGETGWRFTPEESAQIDAAVSLAIESRNLPRYGARVVNLEELDDYLNRIGAFESLVQIDQSPWATGYGLFENVMRDRTVGLPRVHRHLQSLYEAYLFTYRRMIDFNFPTLAKAFPLRALMPFRVYLDPHMDLSRSDGAQIAGGYTTVVEKLPPAKENEVVICSPGELSGTLAEASYRGTQIPGARSRMSNDLARLMYHVGGRTLETMIYERIAAEWPRVKEQLQARESE